MNNTIGYLLKWGQAQLIHSQTDTPKLDIELLLLAASKSQALSKIDLVVNPQIILSQENISLFESYVKRRMIGEPIAFILGHQPFWSLDLLVSHQTLMPRPETELLIEIVLEKMQGQKSQSVLDLGTGTGAIALSLAKEKPHWSITATDINSETLEIAKKNAVLHHLDQVVFKLGSWFEAVEGSQFSVIVSNPPYIAQDDPHLQHPALAYEPLGALVSGTDGLKDIQNIIKQAPLFLKKGGLLVLEHGYNQKMAVQKLLSDSGFKNIASRTDLSGVERSTFGSWL